jgi:diacylglycerol O-acyltransferase
VSVLSYDGQVQFGLIADRKRVDDPVKLASRFTDEFEATVLAVLLGPWLESGPEPRN